METGCIISDHHGIYVYEMLRDFAKSEGWQGDYGLDDLDEMVNGSDQALDYLNENVAESGHSFGWWEGNVMYWADKEWQEGQQ